MIGQCDRGHLGEVNTPCLECRTAQRGATLLPGPPTLPSPPDEVPPGWAHKGNAWKALALELEGLTEDPLASWTDVRDAARKLADLARLP